MDCRIKNSLEGFQARKVIIIGNSENRVPAQPIPDNPNAVDGNCLDELGIAGIIGYVTLWLPYTVLSNFAKCVTGRL